MASTYLAIDLKSFYASVECVERKLNPLTTNLVVADKSRTSKTICLAVSPSLKSYGLKGRERLFTVEQKVKEINWERQKKIPSHRFEGKSFVDPEVKKNPRLALDYVVATPRMSLYIQYSTKIYGIYLRYISKEDIHVYSIDECFLDVTHYLNTYHMTPHEMCRMLIQQILKETGITATGGIGPNLYLAKVAMDIEAKHQKADKDGVRIAQLDEMSYRLKLWNHTPLTDFWRVGKGTERKLNAHNLYTMGDIARCALENNELLYSLFGVNAEFLIDHAFGYEPCTIKAIHDYVPQNHSLSDGQVLHAPIGFEKGKVIVREMAEELSYSLIEKGLVANGVSLSIGYDRENLEKEDIVESYEGEVEVDYLGRKIPKGAHGSLAFSRYTSSEKELSSAFLSIYQRVVNPILTWRRIYLIALNVRPENEPWEEEEQLSLFDNEESEKRKEEDKADKEKERRAQEAILAIKKKYGKNSVLKVLDLKEEATTRERNNEIGGHKS